MLRRFILAFMVLVNLEMISLQASSQYVDYWETLQEKEGYLTISSIWKESNSFFSNIRFFIAEDQGNHAPILLTVVPFNADIVEGDFWESGDLVVFSFIGEENYYVTNLRTQTTVMVREELGTLGSRVPK